MYSGHYTQILSVTTDYFQLGTTIRYNIGDKSLCIMILMVWRLTNYNVFFLTEALIHRTIRPIGIRPNDLILLSDYLMTTRLTKANVTSLTTTNYEKSRSFSFQHLPLVSARIHNPFKMVTNWSICCACDPPNDPVIASDGSCFIFINPFGARFCAP